MRVTYRSLFGCFLHETIRISIPVKQWQKNAVRMIEDNRPIDRMREKEKREISP